MIKFLDLYRQYESIKSEIDAGIAAVIHDSAFVGGKFLSAFEESFAAFQGVKFCVGVANGTDAIEIAIEALGLPGKSEILVPANSFIATSEAVTRSGHKVVFCDCDPQTYAISVADARKRMNPRVKAVIPVHLYGHPADMAAVSEFASEFQLKIIEDCAQAHGADYKGKRVGGFGEISTFSFYPGKNLGAYGDGGAIVTNNEESAKKCRMIANHGRVAKYDHAFEGRNSRLDGLQCAILTTKLRHLEKWNEHRRNVAKWYMEELAETKEITLPKPSAWAKPVWHLFVIRTLRRDDLKDFLHKNGVETGIHYPMALPRLHAYQYLGQASEAMCANTIDAELLSLPCHEFLTLSEVQEVSRMIKHFFLENRGSQQGQI